LDDLGSNTMGIASATVPVSIEQVRGRRARKRAAAQLNAGVDAPLVLSHPLVGSSLGTIERRYGLMSSAEQVTVIEVLATSGDLAVADRMAFIAAMERQASIVVVEVEGWYAACATSTSIDPAQLVALRRPENDAPRIMSIVSDRGITPSLGPLSA